MMTWGGSRFPAVNSIRKTRLNRQLNRDTAKATIDAKKRVMITPGIATMSEFR